MDGQSPRPHHFTLGQRNRLIVALRRSGWTLQEVGELIGCTRERVRQIEQEHGGSTYDGRADRARRTRRARELKERRIRDRRSADGTWWTTEDLVAAVELAWETLGHRPTCDDYLRVAPHQDWPSAALIDERLGWNHAVNLAAAGRRQR